MPLEFGQADGAPVGVRAVTIFLCDSAILAETLLWGKDKFKMTVCPAIVFSNVSAGQFQNLANAVTSHFGIPVNGSGGTQSKFGYTITWSFNATKATLTIQCLAYPPQFILCPGVINDYIFALAATFGLRGAVSASAAPGAPAWPRVSAAATRQKMVNMTAAPPPHGACLPVVFSNITAGQFQSLAASLNGKYGIQVNGPAGTQSKNGATITWNFNAAANTLTVQCLAHPIYVGCPLINSEIQALAAHLGVT
jgi:hypothetical protein